MNNVARMEIFQAAEDLRRESDRIGWRQGSVLGYLNTIRIIHS